MNQDNTFIALDIGTSFIKGAILDLDQQELRGIQRQPFPELIAGLPANFFEVAPDTLVAAVQPLLYSLLEQEPNCQGIVTCTQMHGLVLTDEAYQPLTNVITWRDQRAITAHPSGHGTYYDVLCQRLTAEERSQLGGGLRAGLPIGTLFWLAEEGKLPQAPAIPLTLSEYLLTTFCTENLHPRIEPTNAAAYGTYNLTSGTWYIDVLEKLGLDHLKWPEIGSIQSVVGTINIDGRSIPCYASVGDHQCALAGSFLQNGELSLNIATGSQASLITPTLMLGEYETRPYFDQRFINTWAKIPAGRSLTLLVNLLTEIAQTQGIELSDPWTTITQAVEQIMRTSPESDLEIDLSFYDSTEVSAGSFTNVREDNLSVGHLFLAAFQSMAQNYLSSGLKIAGDQNSWERIVFSGGLAQKLEPLRQAILDTFQQAGLNHSHRLCAEEEDTLLGLMVLARYISGEADSVAEATKSIAQK